MAAAKLRLLSCFFFVISGVLCYDDWDLVNKYCPIHETSVMTPSSTGEKFFIYSYHSTYERVIQSSFEQYLGGGGGHRNRESDSEFYGEIEIWCDLFKHPQRTWNGEEASLFIVPVFPHLLKDETNIIIEQIKNEPYWFKNQGQDHLVFCTHWECHANLAGPLFNNFVLPGYLGAIERNYKWIDPRLHRLDSTQDWARISPKPLTKYDSTLCPERIIIIPYPPHQGIISCRPKNKNKNKSMTDSISPNLNNTLPNMNEDLLINNQERKSLVFFAGTLREKLCGMNLDGSEHDVDGSKGVRTSTSMEKLLKRYANLSSTSTSAFSRTINSMEVLSEELKKKKFNIFMLQSRAHGGKRIGGLEGNSYPKMVSSSYFCLHLRGDTPTSRRFYDAIAAGCLPLVISDSFGSSLPFIINNDIKYNEWITIIKQDLFAKDPIGEINKILSLYFDGDLNNLKDEALKPKPILKQMQLAMARDAPKLTLCSGTGGVGNQVIQEVFTRIKQRRINDSNRGGSGGSGVSGGQCLHDNHKHQLKLYAVEEEGGVDGWMKSMYDQYHTDWTWCTEIATTFKDYHGKEVIYDRLNHSLPINNLVHVS